MPKYFRFFIKKNAQIIFRIFGHLQGKKEIFFSFYLDFVWKKNHFFLK